MLEATQEHQIGQNDMMSNLIKQRTSMLDEAAATDDNEELANSQEDRSCKILDLLKSSLKVSFDRAFSEVQSKTEDPTKLIDGKDGTKTTDFKKPRVAK